MHLSNFTVDVFHPLCFDTSNEKKKKKEKKILCFIVIFIENGNEISAFEVPNEHGKKSLVFANGELKGSSDTYSK